MKRHETKGKSARIVTSPAAPSQLFHDSSGGPAQGLRQLHQAHLHRTVAVRVPETAVNAMPTQRIGNAVRVTAVIAVIRRGSELQR